MAKFFVYPFAIAGDLTTIPDPTQSGGSVSYQQGFGIDYQLPFGSNPNALPIPRGSMNQLFNDITTAIQQWQVHGIPDFITTSDNDGSPYPYDIYSLVRYNPGSGVQIYISTVSSNTTLPTNTTNWAQISGGGGFGLPPGAQMNFYGTSLPNGFLLRDGSAVSRATYADLFAAIGVTWGIGNGSTTFNLPNSVRRISMGAGGTGTSTIGNAVGNIGGEETHTQLLAEMAAHSHAPLTAGNNFNSINPTAGSSFVPTTYTNSFNSDPTTDIKGSSTPFNIIQPAEIILPCIKY